jgi:hypothetical protein
MSGRNFTLARSEARGSDGDMTTNRVAGDYP